MKNIDILTNPKGNNTQVSAEVPVGVRLIRFFFKNLSWLHTGFATKLAVDIFTTPGKPVFKPRDLEAIGQSEQQWVEKGKYRIKVYSWGRSDAPVALMVHGWGTKATTWTSFIPGLLAKGFRVVAFDAPAHGHSAGKQSNMIEFAEVVQAVMEKTRNVEVIIAHSLGGSATIFSLSQLQPGTHVKKLVTINSPSSVYEVIKRYAEQVALTGRVHQKMEKAIGELAGMSIHEFNLGRLSRKMKVDEMLIVHDRGDDTVPFFHAEELFSHRENGRMLITEGYGHNRPLRDAKVIEKILAFSQSSVISEQSSVIS